MIDNRSIDERVERDSRIVRSFYLFLIFFGLAMTIAMYFMNQPIAAPGWLSAAVTGFYIRDREKYWDSLRRLDLIDYEVKLNER